MKKALIAMAVLGAFAASASAQSSVTLYGKIDVSAGKNIGTADNAIMDGAAGSRLGFKGTEDLGNGMKAMFVLEHGVNPDTGTQASSSMFWNRMAFVGLEGGWGRLTLGYQYHPAFLLVQNQVDPWAGETVAGMRGGAMLIGGGMAWQSAPTNILGNPRVQNSIAYNIAFSGFNAGVLVGEATSPAANKPVSVGLSYNSGPIFVGVGYEDSTLASNPSQIINVGAAYDFGWMKLSGAYSQGNNALDQDRKAAMIGANIPMGNGAFKVGYTKQTGYQKIGLGYHYNLSKRTKIYADVANGSGDWGPKDEKMGYDLGVQHNF